MMPRDGGGKLVRNAPFSRMQSTAAARTVAPERAAPACFGASRSH